MPPTGLGILKPGEKDVTLDKQSRALAETVVASFIDRIIAEARLKGGSLTEDDIRALGGEMERKADALQAVFKHSIEEYIQMRERASWDKNRKFPFDRMLVEEFSELFHDVGGPPLSEGGLPRRILPGFFLAMRMMLGEDNMDNFQARARVIVDRHRVLAYGAVDWEALHEDQETLDLVLEALIIAAPYFKDLDKREHWFCDVVNANLAPINEKMSQQEQHWQMEHLAYLKLVEGVLTPLREFIATPDQRDELDAAYGAGTADTIKHAINGVGEALWGKD
ncbi:MAG: hypothetical protein OQK35_04165 [Alphaproteobacteria bacterium]|nr:hypothetical protein [Alphaproteobacteria bacterium]